MDPVSVLALLLVVVAGILALIDMFAPRPRLLHVSVLLLVLGVLVALFGGALVGG